MSPPPSIALGELMVTRSGAVDPAKHPAEFFDLYSIPAYDSGKPEVVAGNAIGSAKQVVEPGDVLLSRIVPHIRRAWVVGNDVGRRILASGEWIVFRSDRVHPEYLRHVLVSNPFHVQFMRTVSGVGGSLLRARPAYVARIEIPIPPLSEQRRIAEILDRAEALRAQRRAALAQLDTVTQSIFLDLFGDPTSNPKGWPAASVGAVAFVYVPTRDKPKRFIGAIPWVTLPDIDGLFLSSARNLLTVEDAAEVGNRLIPATSVLLSCAATLGEVAVTTVPVFTNQQFYALTPKENVITAEFLALCLRLKGKHFFERLGGSFTIGFFSKQKASEIPIPLPPFELQCGFSTRVRTVEKLRQVHERALAELDDLFSSIQSKAFLGEL